VTRAPVYCALVHHPVLDKIGGVAATSVTNFDVHDIARAAKTYGLHGYYVIAPLEVQRRVVVQIARHWVSGPGAMRLPARGKALSLVRTAPDIRTACDLIADESGGVRPVVWATGARPRESMLPHDQARAFITESSRPILILFGTGYGLAEEVMAAADAILAPLGDPCGWNHLSVRCAAAITLDRLLGDREIPHAGSLASEKNNI